MPHAIRIHRTGGPEVLQWEAVELPPPAAGEVRLRHHAVGLTSSTPTTAAACIRCRCPPASAWKARVWSRRWARA